MVNARLPAVRASPVFRVRATTLRTNEAKRRIAARTFIVVFASRAPHQRCDYPTRAEATAGRSAFVVSLAVRGRPMTSVAAGDAAELPRSLP